jgi:serine/alanine adding enzyme
MYHLYRWSTVFREVFGCETHHLIVETNGEIAGLLPLFSVKSSLVGGNYVSSMPGGVCTSDEGTAQLLIQAAIEITRERGARYLSLRDGYRRWNDDRLTTQVEYTYVLHDLSPGAEAIWRQLSKNVRWAVRRARKAGLVAVWDCENLDSFYRVYATTMRDLGTPAVPRRFFEESLEQFPDNLRILTVRQADRILGGFVAFVFKGVLNGLFGSSLRDARKLGPNDLAFWETIRYACENGCRAADLGRSAAGSGHAWFKRKFLAKPREVYYQYYLNTARTAPVARGHKLYPLVSPIWRRLPLPVADALSPVIRRSFPLG